MWRWNPSSFTRILHGGEIPNYQSNKPTDRPTNKRSNSTKQTNKQTNKQREKERKKNKQQKKEKDLVYHMSYHIYIEFSCKMQKSAIAICLQVPLPSTSPPGSVAATHPFRVSGSRPGGRLAFCGCCRMNLENMMQCKCSNPKVSGNLCIFKTSKVGASSLDFNFSAFRSLIWPNPTVWMQQCVWTFCRDLSCIGLTVAGMTLISARHRLLLEGRPEKMPSHQRYLEDIWRHTTGKTARESEHLVASSISNGIHVFPTPPCGSWWLPPVSNSRWPQKDVHL